MIFTVFLADGSKYSYEYEKYDWSFIDSKYFCVTNKEQMYRVLFCPVEQIVKIVTEGDEL